MVSLQVNSAVNNSKSTLDFTKNLSNYKRKLVKLEVDYITQIKAKWEQILANDRTDRQRAERAIADCYQSAGFTAPKIVWAENPLNAIMVLVNRRDLVSIGDQILQKIWDSCHQEIYTKIDPEEVRMVMAQANPRAEIVGDIYNIKFDPWGDYFNSLLMRQVPKIYPDLNLAELPVPLQDYRVAYLSYLDYFYTIGISIPQIEPLIDLAQSAGWCWAFENLAIVTPKPSQVAFNDAGELIAIDYEGVNILG
jgi:hypothetical protein